MLKTTLPHRNFNYVNNPTMVTENPMNFYQIMTEQRLEKNQPHFIQNDEDLNLAILLSKSSFQSTTQNRDEQDLDLAIFLSKSEQLQTEQINLENLENPNFKQLQTEQINLENLEKSTEQINLENPENSNFKQLQTEQINLENLENPNFKQINLENLENPRDLEKSGKSQNSPRNEEFSNAENLKCEILDFSRDFLIHQKLKQMEEDENLAYYLQTQEKCQFQYQKMDPLESKKSLSLFEYDLIAPKKTEKRNPINSEEYNYSEPYLSGSNRSIIEPPILYDLAQRTEDMEIAHVPKRMPQKRLNAMPVALHHKDFPVQRNHKKTKVCPSQQKKSKFRTPFLQFLAEKTSLNSESNSEEHSPEISESNSASLDQNNKNFKRKPINKTSLRDSIKNPEEYSYGLVLKVLGARRFSVFCYSDCTTKICWLPGKMMYNSNWIYRGSVVLIKFRTYQAKKADIVRGFSELEYKYLCHVGELKECDPRKWLSKEILEKILNYVDVKSRENFWVV